MKSWQIVAILLVVVVIIIWLPSLIISIKTKTYRRQRPYYDQLPPNGLALAAVIVVWFSSLIGLVLGAVALQQVKTRNQRGYGQALTALVYGIIGTAFGLLISILYVVLSLGQASGAFR